jgi:hypothetical protein
MICSRHLLQHLHVYLIDYHAEEKKDQQFDFIENKENDLLEHPFVIHHPHLIMIDQNQ